MKNTLFSNFSYQADNNLAYISTNKDNIRNDLKTYINKQITISPKVLKINPKIDKILHNYIY